jgi:hypothetical protein
MNGSCQVEPPRETAARAVALSPILATNAAGRGVRLVSSTIAAELGLLP